MPKRVPPLTDIQINKERPKEKDSKLADGGGLYLLVTTAGSKLWRFKYRFADKEKLLALGSYPEISLSEARKQREEARRLLANGTDPGKPKKRPGKRRRNDAPTHSRNLPWNGTSARLTTLPNAPAR